MFRHLFNLLVWFVPASMRLVPDPDPVEVGECQTCQEPVMRGDEVRDTGFGLSPFKCMSAFCNSENEPPDGLADKDDKGAFVAYYDSPDQLEETSPLPWQHHGFGPAAA